ncbi:sialate O-acetylesterase [Sphingobacterium griseoflavum]|uniref:Sialate O-acetylesterase domain-containing protein n=1 Tax=Sphingobacterium griseoflavum TaxID=1474952 RepID=A0ABQ3HVD1_9SPHI|nr:sialate O-acetylesterase [Sphingobacterium griseoflavum]GHE35240.1 hypothetical protein GCM10017764_18120 [Sphingobacterium griseoflavum]
MNKKVALFLVSILSMISLQLCYAQDPNFHIYLCFGQSNMEGHGQFEPQDTIADPRFRVLAAVDCPDINRVKGEWYKAVPPLSRCHTGLTPADYFGKTLLANLADSIQVGIINVSVGGCHIQLFDKDSTSSYVQKAPKWMKDMLAAYDDDPYGRLIEMAKVAQKDGVIRGILLHQGESNVGDKFWPYKVKRVYEHILSDLSLKAEQTPLLVGEMLAAEEWGKCAGMNEIIRTIPQVIPTAHIVSSKDCEGIADLIHFSPAGYRQLGKNYAFTLMQLDRTK